MTLLRMHRICVNVSCRWQQGEGVKGWLRLWQGEVGIFGGGVNENVFGLNSGALALSGLPNEAPQAWLNAWCS
jgi:hypothetical protein